MIGPAVQVRRPQRPADDVVALMADTIERRALRGLETSERDLRAAGFTVTEVDVYGPGAVGRARSRYPSVAEALEDAA